MRSAASLFSFVTFALVISIAINLNLQVQLVSAQPQESSNPQDSSSSSSESPLTYSELISQANTALSTGKYLQALNSFDQAIAIDPTAWLTYYRRATASLSLGRTSAALQDLDKLISLNPGFAKAHLQKSKVLAKEGELEKAITSIDSYLSLKNKDEEGLKLKEKIGNAEKSLRKVRKTLAEVRKSLAKGKKSKDDPSLKKLVADCEESTTVTLDLAPNHLEARRTRAECRAVDDQLENAVGDWSRVLALAPSPPLYLLLSSLSFFVLGDQTSREAGILHLKSCLTSDPDNKLCLKAHRRAKNVEKSLKKARNYSDANSWRPVISSLKGKKVSGPDIIQEVENAIRDDLLPTQNGEEEEEVEPILKPSTLTLEEALKRSDLLLELKGLHCQAYMELNELEKAMPFCNDVLQKDSDFIPALVAKGEQLLAEEKYEEAVRELTNAFEKSGRSDRKIQQRLLKAQGRLKQSKSKDYYKVLEIPRSASDKEIKKAYRRLARLHHPDKGGDQEKMAQVNEAFGVLGNAELKQRFDNGDDPNDPQGQQGGHGNPFAQGGHPFFQQGGFQFQQGGHHQFFQNSHGGFRFN